MPAALSPAEPSKTWWSLSRSPSSKDLRQKYEQEGEAQPAKVSKKLNSFVSAIGFKSKKPPAPTLAIQDPPSYADHVSPLPSPNPVSPISPRPSKAASSTRSRVDSLEPRTPNDFIRDRRMSLLTLSDTDPFAGRPMIVPNNLPPDPNRLSAYSNSSVNDLSQKRGDVPPFNRVSYASSSSNSNYHSPDFPPVPAIAPGKASEVRQLHTKRSMGSLQLKRPDPLLRQASMTSSQTSTASSTGPSSASTAPRKGQTDSGPTRPKMRARGMTDGGGITRAGFFVDEHPPLRKPSQKVNSPAFPPPSPEIPSAPGPSASPRVVVRQASSSRLHTPPSAPPTHRLPSPPQLSKGSKKQQSDSQTKSASSSCVSFSSAISLTNEMFANPAIEKRASGRSNYSQTTFGDLEGPYNDRGSKTASSSSKTLKKMSSQSSLSRRDNVASNATPKTSPDPSEKGFRKQRSFYHPRLPIPSIPLPVRASTSSGSSPFPSAAADSGHSPSVEQRRGSTASSLGRKRLFSNNSTHNRPSTAQPVSTVEDDKLSLFSLRSDNDSHLLPYKPWSTSTIYSTSSPSFWDEGASEVLPRSPIRSVPDYTPQAIMSKADLAKLDSEDSTSIFPATRTRGFSILSASTVASSHLSRDQDSEVIPIGLSPPPPSSRQSGKQLSLRMSSNSYTGRPSGSKPLSPNSVADSLFSRDDHDDGRRMQPISSPISQETLRPSSPASTAMTSLPPPPRRHRPTPLQPTDPPPSSRASSIKKTGSVRSMVTMEKAIHRRSIMKKPSFLDFGAETDDETSEEAVDPRVTSSFLDMARESFETARSDD